MQSAVLLPPLHIRLGIKNKGWVFFFPFGVLVLSREEAFG